MRRSPALLAVALCVVATTAACAQTGTSMRLNKIPGTINFNYDAQRGQITSSGLQVMPSVKSNASVAPTTGTITVTININLASHFAKGTSFHCSLEAIGGILDFTNGTVDGAIETVNGIAASAGAGTATCTLSIPYAWTLPPDPTGASGLVLAFGVAAVTDRDTQPMVQRSTLQLDGIENLPASGATSKYAFDVTL